MKRNLLLPLLMILTFMVSAQSDFFKQPAFSISLVQHSVGIPFKDFIKKPFNFGIAFAAEFAYDERQFQKLEIGWYHHKYLHSALWIKTDFLRRFQSTEGMYAEVQTGLGFIKSFNENESFDLNSEGVYKPVKNAGKNGFLVGAGIGTGYRLSIDDKLELSPFVNYQGFLQLPYSNIAPVFPHSLLSVGTRFKSLK